jgi:hypothetical protein
MNHHREAATFHIQATVAGLLCQLSLPQRMLLAQVARYHGTHLQLQKVQRHLRPQETAIYHWGNPARMLGTIQAPRQDTVVELLRQQLLKHEGTFKHPKLRLEPTLLGWVLVQHLDELALEPRRA